MTERLFLVKKIPQEVQRWRVNKYRYGWVPTADREILLKEIDDKRFLSIGLNNSAPAFHEMKVEKGDFDNLWPETNGSRLSFTRRQGKIGRWNVSIDSFQESLAGLEIIRTSVPENTVARTSLGWDWLGVEITYDPRFSWLSLAGGSVRPEISESLTEAHFTGAVGAVPYIRSPEGIKVILVTTQKKDRWIFPKGQLKAGLSLKDVALMEAAEEAGVIGEVTGDPILCSFGKSNSVIDLILFPMEVKSMLKIWQETEVRERAQFDLVDLQSKPEWESLFPGLSMVQNMALGFDK